MNYMVRTEENFIATVFIEQDTFSLMLLFVSKLQKAAERLWKKCTFRMEL